MEVKSIEITAISFILGYHSNPFSGQKFFSLSQVILPATLEAHVNFLRVKPIMRLFP